MDKKCLRGKSYDEVMMAKNKTNSIINPDKLFLVAAQWGPTIDGKYLKRQPLEVLRDGTYDTTKKVMTGMTTHESEIFVRSLFGQPINDFGFVYGCRALFHSLDDGLEKLEQVCESYNKDWAQYGKSMPSCNSTIGDWSPVSLLPGVETYPFFEPTFPNISDSARSGWNGMLSMDNQVNTS